MRITEEEMQERREMMIQTAVRLFCDYGIENVSMSEIVLYGELYGKENPWEERYRIIESGILSALHAGWNAP